MHKVMMLFIMTSVIFVSGCLETENGEKVGSIIKVSKRGLFWKTWEVTIIKGGINDGSGSFSGTFDFMVLNENHIDKLKNYMDSRKEIKIKYHRVILTMPCRAGTNGYFLDDVE